ncbi:MAG: dITP/XTP pyrophosphatase [Spirochaetes bacterium ADurb.Bin269]|jgi:XTP/dITP diphosphohydrolase|nr:MAG: dITP/XTP pyrophosphatase [Spirochaetes bacterium ADurb.Bin269]
MTLYFASGNRHKRDELERIFHPHSIRIPADDGIDFNPEETGNDFISNALIKAEALYRIVQKPVLADDSGICVDALGGLPGVKSARFGQDEGLELDSGGKNLLLLTKMKGVADRNCRFVCSMVLYLSPDRFFCVQETLEGILTHELKGTGGFGYDPLVYVQQYGKTVAELSDAEKDACSHRGKAGRAIAELLNIHCT